jgi:hypothetical protein
MTLGRITRIAFLIFTIVLLSAFIASSGGHPAGAVPRQSRSSQPDCKAVGGTIITNFGAIDPNTTNETATGDLRDPQQERANWSQQKGKFNANT